MEELKGMEANSDVMSQPQLVGEAAAGALPTDLGSLEQVGGVSNGLVLPSQLLGGQPCRWFRPHV